MSRGHNLRVSEVFVALTPGKKGPRRQREEHRSDRTEHNKRHGGIRGGACGGHDTSNFFITAAAEQRIIHCVCFGDAPLDSRKCGRARAKRTRLEPKLRAGRRQDTTTRANLALAILSTTSSAQSDVQGNRLQTGCASWPRLESTASRGRHLLREPSIQ